MTRVYLMADFGKGPVSLAQRMAASVRHAQADIRVGRGTWACRCGACRYSLTRLGGSAWWLVEAESADEARRAIEQYQWAQRTVEQVPQLRGAIGAVSGRILASGGVQ